MNRLKELRQEKKLSQKELAKKIGVHYRTLQNWENGESQIKPDKAQALADYFGVPVGYLLGYVEDRKIYDDEEIYDTEYGVMVFSEKRSGEVQQDLSKQTFLSFIRFFQDNLIWLSDDEINSLYRLILSSNLNSSGNFVAQLFNESAKNGDGFKRITDSGKYNYVFSDKFARNDIEQEIYDYISDETRTQSKSEKLLSVLKSAYGERNYLD